MTDLILNGDLRASHVPTVRCAELEPFEGGHRAAWAKVWRFALTFDPDGYAAATGAKMDWERVLDRLRTQMQTEGRVSGDFAELRAALRWLHGLAGGGAVPEDTALLIDGLLDAIFVDVSGGSQRPMGPGPVRASAR